MADKIQDSMKKRGSVSWGDVNQIPLEIVALAHGQHGTVSIDGPLRWGSLLKAVTYLSPLFFQSNQL